jgi:hypothetical protein
VGKGVGDVPYWDGRFSARVLTSWRVAMSGYPFPCVRSNLNRRYFEETSDSITVIMTPGPGREG